MSLRTPKAPLVLPNLSITFSSHVSHATHDDGMHQETFKIK